MRYFFHIFKYCNSNILQSKTLTQGTDRERLSTNDYLFFVASMIHTSSVNRDNFVRLFTVALEDEQDHPTEKQYYLKQTKPSSLLSIW